MKNSTLISLNKFFIRVQYLIRHLIGLGLIAFGLTCLFTDYDIIPGKKDVTIFISCLCIFIGICVTIVAIFNRVESEYFFKNDKSKQN